MRTVIHAPAELKGPLRRGAAVGKAVVLAGGVPVATVPLLLARAVPAPPAPTVVAGLGAGPFTLLLLALLIGAGIVVRMALQQRQRPTRVTEKRQSQIRAAGRRRR